MEPGMASSLPDYPSLAAKKSQVQQLTQEITPTDVQTPVWPGLMLGWRPWDDQRGPALEISGCIPL
jgi:hypothetical protein